MDIRMMRRQSWGSWEGLAMVRHMYPFDFNGNGEGGYQERNEVVQRRRTDADNDKQLKNFSAQ
jgi:hypothetical protein